MEPKYKVGQVLEQKTREFDDTFGDVGDKITITDVKRTHSGFDYTSEGAQCSYWSERYLDNNFKISEVH